MAAAGGDVLGSGSGGRLHPQVVAWLEEIDLALGPELARGLLDAGFGHSPDAFAALSLPHFHLVLAGLDDLHQRRKLHSLLLRIKSRKAATTSASSPYRAPPPSSSPRVASSSLASPRRPQPVAPSAQSLHAGGHGGPPSKVKSFDSALASFTASHDDLDWTYVRVCDAIRVRV
jgi:hypothetical protein